MYAEMLDEEETALLFQTVSSFYCLSLFDLILVQNASITHG